VCYFFFVCWRFVLAVCGGLCLWFCVRFCVCVFVFICLCLIFLFVNFFFFFICQLTICFFFFFLLLLSIVSVVFGVVCMCSCDQGLCLWYGPPVFWLFLWWTFDMFRRWYHVVYMGCLLYWGGVLLVFVLCVCKRGCCVWYCDPYMYVRDVCQSFDVCFCVICVLCQIFVRKMTVIGCGACVECLCVSRCQCVCCVDLCGGEYVLVVVCVLI